MAQLGYAIDGVFDASSKIFMIACRERIINILYLAERTNLGWSSALEKQPG